MQCLVSVDTMESKHIQYALLLKKKNVNDPSNFK